MCCGNHNHKTEHSGHFQTANQTTAPRMPVSRWVIGFIVAWILIYLLARVF